MSGISPDRGTGLDVTLRAGRPADAEAIRRVHRRSILELGRAGYSQAEVESWAHGLVVERYAEIIATGEERYHVAVDTDGTIIGFSSSTGDEIRALYVDPSAARRGIGGALLRLAEADLLAAGHKRIWVQASRTGQPFYASHGYVMMSEYPWASRGGLDIMVQRMEKDLG